MTRRLRNFIDGFVKYTEGKGSPSIYRKWGAIFLISAVMERKVWIRTSKGQLFPNQYVILVGRAGVGKSLITSLVTRLIEDMKTPENPLYLAPTSVTKASLIDCLDNAQRRIIRPMETPSVVSFNSLTIVPNEFGVFLPSWEGDFMSVLTDLWDCGRYAETRRTNKLSIEIPRTQLNLFSATTPIQLVGLLPEGAWEQGFMSRVLLVYSGDVIHTDLFAESNNDDELWAQMVQDLREIYKTYGQMEVDEEAKQAINAWARAGGPPIPDHPKLSSYNMRRVAHLLKLMMVSCMADGKGMLVTLDHYAEALDWLIELESYMSDVFKSMKSGGDSRAIDECWHFAYQYYMRKKEPVPEHLVFAFLQEKVPAHSIERIVDVMIRAQLFKKQFLNSGGTGYLPKAPNA